MIGLFSNNDWKNDQIIIVNILSETLIAKHIVRFGVMQLMAQHCSLQPYSILRDYLDYFLHCI